MRLIDADKIQWVYKCISKEEIDEQPTVEAIPIEWIERWTKQFWKEIKGVNHYMGDGYDSVWDMLEAWEKENDRTDDN